LEEAELYRLIADRLRLRARAAATPAEADSYGQVADGWDRLADEAEARSDPPGGSSGSKPPGSSAP
jgi:hypothetical protein